MTPSRRLRILRLALSGIFACAPFGVRANGADRCRASLEDAGPPSALAPVSSVSPSTGATAVPLYTPPFSKAQISQGHSVIEKTQAQLADLREELGRVFRNKKKKALIKRIDDAESVLRTQKAQLRNLKDEHVVELRQLYAAHDGDPQWRPYLRDFLNAARVERITAPAALSVMWEGQDPAAWRELIAGALAKGYEIIYDADARGAPVVRELCAGHCLGISRRATGAADVAAASGAQPVLVIENDYLRHMALTHGKSTIISVDSVEGFAAALRSRATFILDPRGEFTPWPRAWLSSLKLERRAETLPEISTPRTLQNAAEAFRAFLPQPEIVSKFSVRYLDAVDGARPRVKIADALALQVPALRWHEAQAGLAYAQSMAAQASPLAELGGTAVFGSALLGSAAENEKLFKLAQRVVALGSPMFTGGSGGAMRIANAAAYAGGGESVGIPIEGRGSLSDELRVFADLQTRTVPVQDYDARIPLMLNGRELVIIAPGRGGTMKEVAITLSRMLGDAAKPQLVFADRGFYRGLFDQIQALPWPAALRERIHLVDGADELSDLLFRLHLEGKLHTQKWRPAGIGHARELNQEQLKFLQP